MSTLTLHKTRGHRYATSFSPGLQRLRGAQPTRLRRLAARLVRMLMRAIARQRANRACKELARLDDRMLRDIGLTRSSLHHVVHARTFEMLGVYAPLSEERIVDDPSSTMDKCARSDR
jgi:uncharacterized protein YjiS (DUF1127 family)